ncbi:MAG: anhydro-N-acetylmuramic acid kinase [Litoreibacter sp.]
MKKTEAIWALGAMSGTSLDGVDAAMVLTDGAHIHAFGPSEYRPYSEAERDILRAGLGAWPHEPRAGAAAKVIENAHVEVLSNFPDVDVIGFHGQTLAHDPGGLGTHQAGDGAALADALGHPVVWDFRSLDVAKGGQGAPLAPVYHAACAHYIKASEPLAFLNLGGVGNITYVDPRMRSPEAIGALLAFDTGPANAPVNDLMKQRLGLEFDQDGTLAASGQVATTIVDQFLQHPYFQSIPPKSLDRDDFSNLLDMVSSLNDADAAATLTECCVVGVKLSLRHMPLPPTKILVTGGGRKNEHIMNGLRSTSNIDVVDIDHAGLDGDMLEAQAFAHLAVRVSRNMPTSFPSTTGVPMAVCGGVLSYPRGISKSGGASVKPSN